MGRKVLDELLEREGVIVLDGAQGTELERRGVNLGSSKLWSAQLLIDDPDLLRAIHLDYLRAGSDVITTFTYQASLPGFAEAGLDAVRAAELLNLAVDLAHSARTQFLQEQEQEQKQEEQAAREARPDGPRRTQQEQGAAEQEAQGGSGQQQPPQPLPEGAPQGPAGRGPQPGPRQGGPLQDPGIDQGQAPLAAGAGAAAATSTMPAAVTAAAPTSRRPLIAFACGSYGGYLADGSEFRGDYAESATLDQLAAFHRARLDPVRHRTEIDLLAFETVPCVKEAEAIVSLLRAEQYGKPAWISFSCKDAVHTCHGEPFAERCMPLLAAAAAEGLVVAAGVNCTAPRHVEPLLAAARAQLRDLTYPPVAAAATTGADSAAPPTGTGALASPHEEQPPPQPSTISPPLAPAGGEHRPMVMSAGAVPPPLPAAAAAAPAPAGASPHRPPLLLLCYPNSGEEWDGRHRCWRHAPDDIAQPERFGAAAADWVRGEALGVSLVGGCCRTGPDHIRALRRALRPGGLAAS